MQVNESNKKLQLTFNKSKWIQGLKVSNTDELQILTSKKMIEDIKKLINIKDADRRLAP